MLVRGAMCGLGIILMLMMTIIVCPVLPTVSLVLASIQPVGSSSLPVLTAILAILS